MAGPTLPQTVLEAVSQYASFYSQRDINGLLSIISPDFLGYGSGPDEIVLSAEELRKAVDRDFSQCDELLMEISRPHIREGIRAAWLLADCKISVRINSNLIKMEGRLTVTLRRTPAGWQIAMTHFSMPYADQNAGHSYPETGKND